MKILTRLLVLSVLCLGIGYVLFAPSTPSVLARGCCQTCPGGGSGQPEPDVAEDYCTNHCAPNDDYCINSCVNSINHCWDYCMWCTYGDDSATPPTIHCVSTTGDQGTRITCSVIG